MGRVWLAIESSCDESALALFEPARGLTGEWVHSQVAKHQPFGGIVPEVASREHLAHFPGLLARVEDALGGERPGRIAVTAGPGLAGCLALGLSLGKALALAWRCPLVGVNHLRGHAWSPFIGLHGESPGDFAERLEGLLPHLGLIVSGGNTVLFEIDRARRLTILADTVDDAAGEALDKGAKLLGMPYPGGPLIERAASGGDPGRFAFPRAFLHSGERKFSFSGLKTALRYTLETLDDAALAEAMPDLCASYQGAVVEALVGKTRQLLRAEAGRWRSLGLSGGVANNAALRGAFEALGAAQGLPVLLAARAHTGDNAAMIAFAAWVDPVATRPDTDFTLSFDPNWELA
jgi:N6-L-threonylcarbamoyladenine synthase